MGGFERSGMFEGVGHKLGYLFAYFIFTTIFYAVLLLLQKIPSSWSYLHIAVITLGIAILGIMTRRFLK